MDKEKERILKLNFSEGRVYFTPKCKVNCWFCSSRQNPDFLQDRLTFPGLTADKILSLIPDNKDKVEIGEGMILNEGDPLYHPDWKYLIREIKKRDKKISLSTSLEVELAEEDIKFLLKYVDDLRVSVHSLDSEFKNNYFNNLGYLKKNLLIIKKLDIGKVCLRFTLVPIREHLKYYIPTIKELIKEKWVDKVNITLVNYTDNASKKVKNRIDDIDFKYYEQVLKRLKEKYPIKIQYSPNEFRVKDIEIKESGMLDIEGIGYFDFSSLNPIRKNNSKNTLILTSEKAYPLFRKFSKEEFLGDVIKIKNSTFGGSISCLGLLTIRDFKTSLERIDISKYSNIYTNSRFLDKDGYDLEGVHYSELAKYLDNKLIIIDVDDSC